MTRNPDAVFGEYVRDVGFRLELTSRQVGWILAKAEGRNAPIGLDDFDSLLRRGLVVCRTQALREELTVAGMKVAELLRFAGFGDENTLFLVEHIGDGDYPPPAAWPRKRSA